MYCISGLVSMVLKQKRCFSGCHGKLRKHQEDTSGLTVWDHAKPWAGLQFIIHQHLRRETTCTLMMLLLQSGKPQSAEIADLVIGELDSQSAYSVDNLPADSLLGSALEAYVTVLDPPSGAYIS